MGPHNNTIILLADNLPKVNDNDPAFWDRVQIELFNISLSEHLIEDLKEEAIGIINWIIRGFLIYKEQGINPPQ
ncbi:MAG: hypothetical protein SRB2_02148 [Desulfobacteraceae bacterium Eth-SRB2]|nr:MAG: hypothetical protein SRB2_02148 [Desulfobacteraceae bacterium Eth-SRB2]